MSHLIAFVANSAWNLRHFRGNLILRLLDDDYDVLIIAPYDASSDQLAALGCRVVNQPMDNKGTNPLADLQTMRALRRLYRQHQPDLVMHYTIKPVIYGTFAARSLKIPVINTITGLGTAFLGQGWLMRLVENLYRYSQRWPSQVFFQNPDDRSLFLSRHLVADDKSRCVPGSGVDLDYFELVPPPLSRPLTFLLIARLLRDKGVVEFVDAARIIRADYPAARFQLLGPLGADNRTALTETDIADWIDSGLIEYAGETDDVRPYIHSAHCVVLPSYREGTPRSLLEAAAVGRPLIATDVPGCREVVDAGINGFLCQVKSAESLADAMLEFINLSNDQQHQMGLESRKKIEAEFDQEFVITAYLTEIKRVLD